MAISPDTRITHLTPHWGHTSKVGRTLRAGGLGKKPADTGPVGFSFVVERVGESPVVMGFVGTLSKGEPDTSWIPGSPDYVPNGSVHVDSQIVTARKKDGYIRSGDIWVTQERVAGVVVDTVEAAKQADIQAAKTDAYLGRVYRRRVERNAQLHMRFQATQQDLRRGSTPRDRCSILVGI